jgi:hypothetical protein
MRKRFILKESDKNDIRKMYGLINESDYETDIDSYDSWDDYDTQEFWDHFSGFEVGDILVKDTNPKSQNLYLITEINKENNYIKVFDCGEMDFSLSGKRYAIFSGRKTHTLTPKDVTEVLNNFRGINPDEKEIIDYAYDEYRNNINKIERITGVEIKL